MQNVTIYGVCKVSGKRLPPAQTYRRGEVSSPEMLSASRNAQNTRNTLKEEVFSASSAFSVGSAIQTKGRAGKPGTYATVSKTLHTHEIIDNGFTQRLVSASA